MKSKVVKLCLRSVMFLVAISLLSGTFACLQAEEINWAKELKNWEGRELRVIMIADPWVDAFSVINPEFEKLTGARVMVDAYPYDGTHEKQIMIGAGRSADYDVIVLDCPWVGEFAEVGYVEDLTPYIKASNPEVVAWDDYLEAYKTVATWKGEITGMPFGAYHVLFHYRKDLFSEAGFTPPKTLEEWKKIGAYFTNNPEYPGLYGTALNYFRGAPIGQGWFEYIWNVGGKPFESNYPGSPDPYADMTPRINSPEGREVVQLFIDMVKYGPPGVTSYAWDERATAFAMRKIAMVSVWSARTPLFVDPARSEITDKFATAVVPAKKGVKTVPPLGGWVMGINKFSVQKDLAWDYIKWFTSIPIHKKFMRAKPVGGPPSRYSAMLDPELNKMFPWYKSIYESAKLTYEDCRPRIPESFEIIDTIGLYTSKAVGGELTAEKAMEEAEKKIKSVLATGGYYIRE